MHRYITFSKVKLFFLSQPIRLLNTNEHKTQYYIEFTGIYCYHRSRLFI